MNLFSFRIFRPSRGFRAPRAGQPIGGAILPIESGREQDVGRDDYRYFVKIVKD